MQTLGWIGSIMLAICGLPQAYKSYKDKHSDGISWGFLFLWGFGELFTLAYIVPKFDYPLILNYSINLIFIGIIVKYKFSPKG